MNHTPLWVDQAPRPELRGNAPADADVAVIGSGLTGLSAALRLAKAGKAVVVFDSGDIGSGASSMNGGMVSPDIKAGMKAIWRSYGPKIAQEMWDASVRSVDFVADLASRPEIGATVARGGMVGLGTKARHHADFSKQVSWYREEFHVEWEVLGKTELTSLVAGSDRFTAAIYEPEGFGVQPAELTFGIAKTAKAAGAALVASTHVESVAREGAGYRLGLAGGASVRAGEVIVATNGYTTAEPIPALVHKIVSIGSYIISTEPLGADRAAAIFPKNSMSYTKKRLLNYMRRTPDHRIIIGGRRNLRPGLDLGESATDLRRQLIHLWPDLADVEITHAWGGRLGVPFDLIPHVGSIDGVRYAMGYAGHGVGLAALLGHELAGELLGEDPPSVFSQIPHHGRWYYRGRPWFLGPASLLYRNLDRVGF